MGNEPGQTGRSRRQFIRDAAVTGLATASGLLVVPKPAGAAPPGTARPGGRVAVLGGGVAGLSAALELAERGFRVTVYERKELGGKARSIPVPNSATDGREPLPGEHGFRFFPGFYWNLGDTMRRIPFPGNEHGTWDNLVRATAYRAARAGRADLTLALPFPPPPALTPAPYTPESFVETIAAALTTGLRIPPDEAAFFARKVLVYATSSDERRFGQWEYLTWDDFVRADAMSEEYRRMFAQGLVRNLVAMKPSEASAHSIGLVSEAMVWSLLGRGNEPGGSVDRLLNGPTNERWIDPWVAQLRALGVEFRVGHTVEALHVAQRTVDSVTVRDRFGQTQRITADWYLAAMPVERFVRLLRPDVLAADPGLAGARRLRTDWMTGLMFYLRRPVPLTPGHVNYIDAPWALTSISQGQFWPRGLQEYGDGTVRDCLSTIISDWVTAGTFNGRAAQDCTPEEIARETWSQIAAHVNDVDGNTLPDELLHSWFLDPALTGSGTPAVANDEPLFIQHVGSWEDRPEPATAIGNLFLAGDWVRTDVNVTTMEGANESARRAVNAILDAAGSAAARCGVWRLFRPPEFEHLKDVDRVRYRAGQPNLFDIDAPLLP